MGKITTQIRLNEELHGELKAIAARELRTMNAQIEYFISQGIAEYARAHPHERW
jgi:hypothetical protein